MNGSNLILGDSLLVFVLVMIQLTDGLKKHGIILAPLVIIAFATCVIRHINHYKLTKKIY